MHTQPEVPNWLWRAANTALVATLAGLALLAAALALGAADPPRAGPLQWQDDFKQGLGRWETEPPPGGRLDDREGALVVDWDSAGPAETAAWAVTPGTVGDFTLEVAGASAAAAYGLVFGWQDAGHFHAVLLNGGGYAEAYTQRGARRETWFAWQQWPHILYGSQNNRLRVDVRGTTVTALINDEVLAMTTLTEIDGRVGVLALGTAPAQVVFSWVRLWAAAAR